MKAKRIMLILKILVGIIVTTTMVFLMIQKNALHMRLFAGSICLFAVVLTVDYVIYLQSKQPERGSFILTSQPRTVVNYASSDKGANQPDLSEIKAPHQIKCKFKYIKYKIYHNGVEIKPNSKFTFVDNMKLDIVLINDLLSPSWLFFAIFDSFNKHSKGPSFENCYVTQYSITLGKIISNVLKFDFSKGLGELSINGVDQFTISPIKSVFSDKCYRRYLIGKYLQFSVIVMIMLAVGILCLIFADSDIFIFNQEQSYN